MYLTRLSFFVLIGLGIGLSLKAQSQRDFSVSIHLAGNVNNLHPFLSSGANSSYIKANIFGGLLEQSPETGELRPLFAVSRPAIETIADGDLKGKWRINYEIRPEAVWDDGSPITGNDFVFSLKILRHPLLPLASSRQEFDFIERVEIDAQNPKKFSIYCNRNYFLAENATGLMYLLPPHIYDPENALAALTLEQLDNEAEREKIEKDETQIAFATDFQSDKYKRNFKYINGGLAYRVRELIPDKRIVLEKKADWWGSKVKEAPALQINPRELTYRRANSEIEAVQELKDGKIDVARLTRPAIFVDLLNNKSFNDQFNVLSAKQYYYYYTGHNMTKPQLADRRVRLALAHLFNREQFISEFFYGLAIPTTNPVSPYKSFYNKKLLPIPFDVNKAKKLLSEAGWKDSDADGVLDKNIDGKKVDMRLEFTYNYENYVRRNIGLSLQAEAKKVGIDIRVQSYVWDTLMSKLERGDFDMYCLATIQDPGWDNFWASWHSDAVHPNGINRSRFRNPEADAILDEIAVTLDEKQLKKLYGRWQEIVQYEQPQIFLFVPEQMLVISKRFKNAAPTVVAPNFAERFFLLNRL